LSGSAARRRLDDLVPAFRPLPDHELQRLSDDALIGYLRAAAGHPSAKRALAILVFGYWSNVRRAVRMKVAAEHVEDLAAEIIESAVRSTFDGESVGEFRGWLKTIGQRRIADFYSKGRGSKPAETPIGARDDDEPDVVEPEVLDDSGAVHVQDAIDQVLSRMSARDCRVVQLLVFEDRPAQEAVDEMAGLSLDNAHQIVTRFRRAVRRELDT